MKRTITYIVWIALAEIVGFISGMLTSDATEIYAQEITKPPLSPPGILFPIAWAILYALMGISAARIYLSGSPKRKVALILFAVQLAFNFAWCFIFFNYQAFAFALVWLLILYVLVIAMTRVFYSIDKWAGLLQIPYILWLTFAAYLNAGVWFLN